MRGGRGESSGGARETEEKDGKIIREEEKATEVRKKWDRVRG